MRICSLSGCRRSAKVTNKISNKCNFIAAELLKLWRNIHTQIHEPYVFYSFFCTSKKTPISYFTEIRIGPKHFQRKEAIIKTTCRWNFEFYFALGWCKREKKKMRNIEYLIKWQEQFFYDIKINETFITWSGRIWCTCYFFLFQWLWLLLCFMCVSFLLHFLFMQWNHQIRYINCVQVLFEVNAAMHQNTRKSL